MAVERISVRPPAVRSGEHQHVDAVVDVIIQLANEDEDDIGFVWCFRGPGLIIERRDLRQISLAARPFRAILVCGEAVRDEPASRAGTICSRSPTSSTGTWGARKMMMAPTADTADGFIDYVRCAELGRMDLLMTFPKIFSGTHVQNPAVSERKVKLVKFHLEDEIDVMVDGEALRLVPRRLEVLPSALLVYA